MVLIDRCFRERRPGVKGRRSSFVTLLVLGISFFPDASFAQSIPAAPPAQNDIPLPPPRPSSIDPPPEPAGPATSSAAISSGDDCLQQLGKEGFEVEIAHQPANNQCVIQTPVRLSRLTFSSGSRVINFPDKPMLACAFAHSFGQWARDLASPLAKGYTGSEIASVHTGPGYECRPRNHVPGAKLSAHGSGLAVDVASFVLSTGQTIAIVDKSASSESLLNALRTSACGWFTTILGPDTDPYHATHWHFDTLQHGSSKNYRICQ